jgi:hypothetical protein
VFQIAPAPNSETTDSDSETWVFGQDRPPRKGKEAHWHSQWSAPLLKTLFEETGSDCQLRGLANATIRYGGDCSGAESPVWALRSISQGLEADSGHFHVEHAFSSEHPDNQGAKAFLQLNVQPKILYNDVVVGFFLLNKASLFNFLCFAEARAKEDCGFDVLSQSRTVPPPVDIYCGGTECVDFSGLNAAPKGEDGQSWQTLRAVFQYIESHVPPIVCLENVLAKQIVKPVSCLLRQLGYVTITFAVNSRHGGVPQSRTRLYIVAVNSLAVKIHVEVKYWPDLLAKVLESLPAKTVDDVLSKDNV